MKNNKRYCRFFLVWGEDEDNVPNPFDDLISIYKKKPTNDKPRVQSE